MMEGYTVSVTALWARLIAKLYQRGTCKIERGSRSDSYSCSIRFRFDSRKKGFCKRLRNTGWIGEAIVAFCVRVAGEHRDPRIERPLCQRVAFAAPRVSRSSPNRDATADRGCSLPPYHRRLPTLRQEASVARPDQHRLRGQGRDSRNGADLER